MANTSTPESRILFALRTSASRFQTSQDYLTLEDRLKIATLLYDRLLLQGGFYTAQAVSTGLVELIRPRAELDDNEVTTLRAEYESLAQRDPPPDFYFAFQPSGNSSPAIPLITGRTEMVLFAEFQTLANRFQGSSKPWLEWLDRGISEDSPPDSWIKEQNTEDVKVQPIGQEIGNPFIRSHVTKGLNHDLALAMIHGATLEIGPIHARLMAQKMERSGFSPTHLIQVVQTYLPSLEHVPWDEILALRVDPAMADFRRVVREIEGEVGQLTDSLDSEALRDRIQTEWNRHMAEAVAALRPSMGQVLTEGAGNVLLDLICSPVPLLGSVLGVTRGVLEFAGERKSWLSVFIRLAK